MTFTVAKLGEVCSFVRGLTYSKSDEVEFSSNVVVRATNIDLSTHKLDFSELRYISDSIQVRDEKRLKKNDILICTASGSKSHLGKVALVEDDLGMAFGGFMGALRVNSTKITPQYLFTFLVSSEFKRHIESLSDGANINNLKFSQIEQLELPLPPLSTQQKIVAKLDSIFAEIDKAKSAAEDNAKNAEALFQSFLSRSLINNTECVSYKLSEICDIARGGSPRPIDKFITEDLDGINWVKIGDATRSKKYIYETKERIIREGISRSRLVNEGDFILSNSMSFGRPYIMRTTGCIHDGWLVLSNYKKHLDIDFFFYLLSSTIVKNQFERLAQGSTVRNLNKELVGKVEVSIPPLEIQIHMVKMLDLVSNSFDKAREAYGRKIIELELLRVSILKTGFTGDLVKE